MALLYSIWCWSATLVLTVFFGSLAILTSWIPPRGNVYLFWARSWARSVLWFCGLGVKIEAAEGARTVPEAIFMSSHESAIDILAMFVAIPQQLRFLAKKSLFYVPFLGWSMWLAGFVPVERESKQSGLHALEMLEKRLRKGLSVLIFPEGTRSRDGKLGKFKKAGFLLAIRTEIPIVPIAVTGAREILGTQGLLIRRGTATVRVGEPIPTKGLGVHDRAALLEKVRGEIRILRGDE
ncbi:MAG TPA: lysophospholipid acyltransferase family protein [Thermoanaerobaculia bacterium]